MAVKMRNNAKPDAVCCECGESQNQVLNMFDLCIGGNVFTICDRCNNEILSKTLKAEVFKNGRVKSPKDLGIIRARENKRFNEKYKEKGLTINQAMKGFKMPEDENE